jgi:hypothetical protein
MEFKNQATRARGCPQSEMLIAAIDSLRWTAVLVLLHSGIASTTSSAAGFAKPLLQPSPDVGSATLLTSLFLYSI